jgi:hypothetical protein
MICTGFGAGIILISAPNRVAPDLPLFKIPIVLFGVVARRNNYR